MKIKKIIKKDLIEIANKYNADDIYLNNISNLPDFIEKDDNKYLLTITGGFDDNDIKTIEINYYDNDNFKYLLEFKKHNNMLDALNFINTEISPYIK